MVSGQNEPSKSSGCDTTNTRAIYTAQGLLKSLSNTRGRLRRRFTGFFQSIGWSPAQAGIEGDFDDLCEV